MRCPAWHCHPRAGQLPAPLRRAPRCLPRPRGCPEGWRQEDRGRNPIPPVPLGNASRQLSSASVNMSDAWRFSLMKIFCFRWKFAVNRAPRTILFRSLYAATWTRNPRGTGVSACCGQPWAMPLHGVARNPGGRGARVWMCEKRRRFRSTFPNAV